MSRNASALSQISRWRRKLVSGPCYLRDGSKTISVCGTNSILTVGNPCQLLRRSPSDVTSKNLSSLVHSFLMHTRTSTVVKFYWIVPTFTIGRSFGDIVPYCMKKLFSCVGISNGLEMVLCQFLLNQRRDVSG